MAKGSVRKKGKKWYYRFYIEDERGRPGTRGKFAGQESKSKRRPCFVRRNEEHTRQRNSWQNPRTPSVGNCGSMVEEEIEAISKQTVMAFGTVNRINSSTLIDKKKKSPAE